MVLEMNCGVQTTLSHLLEETTPQKKEGGPESGGSSVAILQLEIGLYKI
jgi:hypothetical protein